MISLIIWEVIEEDKKAAQDGYLKAVCIGG